jgi:hypothetical protein
MNKEFGKIPEMKLLIGTIMGIFFGLLISQAAFGQEKIAEYGRLISDDEYFNLVRLYDKVSEKTENKESKIYILINKEKKMPLGLFLRYFYGVRDLITESGGVDKESLIVEAGEEQDRQLTRIWIVKKRETLPPFNKISINEKLNQVITKKTLFDSNCIECDESPFIKKYIFGEGLDFLSNQLRANADYKALIDVQVSSAFFTSKRTWNRERNRRLNEIISRLKANKIPRKRFSIRFSEGSYAKIYLLPNRNAK